MKILILTPYIYEPAYSEFARNESGFGMMVRDIFYKVQETEDAYLLSNNFTKGHGSILRHTILGLLSSASVADWIAAMRRAFGNKGQIKGKIREAVYCLDRGNIKKNILSIKPDIVQVHGLGCDSQHFIDVCIETQIPFVVTIHGLLKNDSCASSLDKKIEREKLIWLNSNNVPISVISSGIKNKLISDPYYGLKNDELISVIPNGIDINPTKTTSNIRKKYRIPDEAKIVLTIGTVCQGKNQIQLIRAYEHLNKKVQEHLWVVIIGSIKSDYPIREIIEKSENREHIVLTGFVPHEQLSDFLQEANAIVMTSHEEGFGLSLIEGFVYGIPSLTFSDLDAVDNIYNQNAMMLCKERTDEALTETITAILEKEWDSEWIKEYSKIFSLERMRDKYVCFYKMALDDIHRRIYGEKVKL